MMARAWMEPSNESGSLEGMEPLWDAPAPRTPMAFLELERRVLRVTGQQADAILGYHVVQAHQDAAFVAHAVEAARARHSGLLRHKGQRRTSVWLPGGTLCVVQTPYLRPPSPRRRGRKRTRRGPTGVGVYPVLEALGIGDRVSPATRSQLALYTVQAGSYQEAVVLGCNAGTGAVMHAVGPAVGVGGCRAAPAAGRRGSGRAAAGRRMGEGRSV